MNVFAACQWIGFTLVGLFQVYCIACLFRFRNFHFFKRRRIFLVVLEIFALLGSEVHYLGLMGARARVS